MRQDYTWGASKDYTVTPKKKPAGLLSSFETSSKAKEAARPKETVPKKNPWMATPVFPSGNVTGLTPVWKGGGAPAKPTKSLGSFPTSTAPEKPTDTGSTNVRCQWGVASNGSCKPNPNQTTGGDCGGKTCRSDQDCVNNKCVSKEGESDKCDGVMHKGVCHTKCEDTMGEEYTGTHPKCTLKSTGESVDGNGKGSPSLNTILRPDQTPMLQTLTDEMDLRNMLGNVLNKNNPLFKQARTRALQAMAARGVVNSTMAEESVMTAIMNVAMPIATRVIDDFQRVMAANVNATNAFKAALNQAYYNELLARVDAANTYNLTSMQESQAAWRTKMEMYTGAKDIKDKDAFDRYMAMISSRF